MKTVREYIDEIDDCKRLANELEDAYEWIENENNNYPYNTFVIELAKQKLEAYIELLKDMPVGKGGK